MLYSAGSGCYVNTCKSPQVCGASFCSESNPGGNRLSFRQTDRPRESEKEFVPAELRLNKWLFEFFSIDLNKALCCSSSDVLSLTEAGDSL
ncbi:hypothetical protein DNTS_029780 [Danionella cerebrum]|uniref:Uncharacterized protein n=1 Tax=Danionella cerebrum TaxID=2873325 RepID=A0A553RNU0_9TELE|nr:hypothetical protein DNTS_029780 [Danionella translucida]